MKKLLAILFIAFTVHADTLFVAGNEAFFARSHEDYKLASDPTGNVFDSLIQIDQILYLKRNTPIVIVDTVDTTCVSVKLVGTETIFWTSPNALWK